MRVHRDLMACKCGCGFDTVDYELADVLTDIENYFGVEIQHNSACRCVDYNETVQKAANKLYIPYTSDSQHLYTKADDIVVPGATAYEIYTYLNKKYPNKYGIGRHKTYTHFDVRAKKGRW